MMRCTIYASPGLLPPKGFSTLSLFVTDVTPEAPLATLRPCRAVTRPTEACCHAEGLNRFHAQLCCKSRGAGTQKNLES